MGATPETASWRAIARRAAAFRGGGPAMALAAMAVFGPAVFPLIPFHDDWTYLTAPNPAFSWRQLLPGDAFWRPLDAAWGWLLSFCPWAFPWLNRIAVVGGHAMNVVLLGRVLGRMAVASDGDGGGRTRPGAAPRIPLFLFAFSSSAAATLVSTDTLNQVWSLGFGLAALLAALRGPRPGSNAVFPAAVPALLFASLVAKESGVAWLAVVPLVLWLRDRDTGRFFSGIFRNALLLGTYVAVRFAMHGRAAFCDTSHYEIGFSAVSICRNLALAVGLGASSVDALAFVAGRYAVFAATCLLSAAFWLLRPPFEAGHGRGAFARNLARAAIVAAMAIPHCVMKNLHPAEIHLYPVAAGAALALGTLVPQVPPRRRDAWALASLALLFAIGGIDKYSAAWRHSRETRALWREIVAGGADFSKPGEIRIDEAASPRYSTFMQSPAHGLDYGAAFRSLDGWREPRFTIVPNEAGRPRGRSRVKASW